MVRVLVRIAATWHGLIERAVTREAGAETFGPVVAVAAPVVLIVPTGVLLFASVVLFAVGVSSP